MNYNPLIRISGLLLLGLGLFLPGAQAAPGDLDTTFNSTGFVRESVSINGQDAISGTALQMDGKIIAVGNATYG